MAKGVDSSIAASEVDSCVAAAFWVDGVHLITLTPKKRIDKINKPREFIGLIIGVSLTHRRPTDELCEASCKDTCSRVFVLRILKPMPSPLTGCRVERGLAGQHLHVLILNIVPFTVLWHLWHSPGLVPGDGNIHLGAQPVAVAIFGTYEIGLGSEF